MDMHGHLTGPTESLGVSVRLDCPLLSVVEQILEVGASGRVRIEGGLLTESTERKASCNLSPSAQQNLSQGGGSPIGKFPEGKFLEYERGQRSR